MLASVNECKFSLLLRLAKAASPVELVRHTSPFDDMSLCCHTFTLLCYNLFSFIMNLMLNIV
jgi:hypothetical protein